MFFYLYAATESSETVPAIFPPASTVSVLSGMIKEATQGRIDPSAYSQLDIPRGRHNQFTLESIKTLFKLMKNPSHVEAYEFINRYLNSDPFSMLILTYRIECLAHMVFEEGLKDYQEELAQAACLGIALSHKYCSQVSPFFLLNVNVWTTLALLYPEWQEHYLKEARKFENLYRSKEADRFLGRDNNKLQQPEYLLSKFSQKNILLPFEFFDYCKQYKRNDKNEQCEILYPSSNHGAIQHITFEKIREIPVIREITQLVEEGEYDLVPTVSSLIYVVNFRPAQPHQLNRIKWLIKQNDLNGVSKSASQSLQDLSAAEQLTRTFLLKDPKSYELNHILLQCLILTLSQPSECKRDDLIKKIIEQASWCFLIGQSLQDHWGVCFIFDTWISLGLIEDDPSKAYFCFEQACKVHQNFSRLAHTNFFTKISQEGHLLTKLYSYEEKMALIRVLPGNDFFSRSR